MLEAAARPWRRSNANPTTLPPKPRSIAPPICQPDGINARYACQHCSSLVYCSECAVYRVSRADSYSCGVCNHMRWLHPHLHLCIFISSASSFGMSIVHCSLFGC